MLTLDDIQDYLQDSHKYGKYIMAHCEFHSPDDNPSMMVHSNGYKCMSCGAHGPLENLYEKVSGKVVVREKTYNPSAFIWKRWKESYGSISSIAKLAHRNLVDIPDDGHYLQQRMVDSQIKNCMIGYLNGYYLFPIQNEFGEIDGIVARASPTIQTKNNRYSVSPNCPTKLYIPSWRKVLKDEYLYACFGTIDAISLNICGYAGLTGLSGQALLANHLDRFHKPIYIIPDKHEEKSAIEIQSQLGWRGATLLIDWPQECKDINDVYVKFGIDTCVKLIESAKERYKYE